jgi:hypothetical protein
LATDEPLTLTNAYLHYVVDLWIQQWRRRRARGNVVVVRYADDLVAGFEHEADARAFLDGSTSTGRTGFRPRPSHTWACPVCWLVRKRSYRKLVGRAEAEDARTRGNSTGVRRSETRSNSLAPRCNGTRSRRNLQIRAPNSTCTSSKTSERCSFQSQDARM